FKLHLNLPQHMWIDGVNDESSDSDQINQKKQAWRTTKYQRSKYDHAAAVLHLWVGTTQKFKEIYQLQYYSNSP
ncbi:hypothetical protein ACJX0J_036685, partial [Zea mays]